MTWSHLSTQAESVREGTGRPHLNHVSTVFCEPKKRYTSSDVMATVNLNQSINSTVSLNTLGSPYKYPCPDWLLVDGKDLSIQHHGWGCFAILPRVVMMQVSCKRTTVWMRRIVWWAPSRRAPRTRCRVTTVSTSDAQRQTSPTCSLVVRSSFYWQCTHTQLIN